MTDLTMDIVNLRRELHKYPELSGFEYETVKRIRSFIELHNATTIIDNVGGAGLLAIYEFPEKGPSITIRCELDALPIQEKNDFDYKSVLEGVSHKCGHDGHMAIVAGLVFWIKEQAFTAGKIILLFQPAEETGQGAYQVLKNQHFVDLKTDYIFALHNIPNEPINSILIMENGFSAEVQSFILTVSGKESHASEPENGINPGVGFSEVVLALSKLNVTDPDDDNFTILTPVHINMGQISYGISPANGELHYTIRTWSTDKMSILKAKIEDTIKEVSQAHRLEYEMEWLEYFPASTNDAECNSHVHVAAQENNFNIKERPYPFKFGEDFGWFAKDYKTAMFGIGAGLDSPALHSLDYDFPDQIIETGMSMFKSIILNIMKSNNVSNTTHK